MLSGRRTIGLEQGEQLAFDYSRTNQMYIQSSIFPLILFDLIMK